MTRIYEKREDIPYVQENWRPHEKVKIVKKDLDGKGTRTYSRIEYHDVKQKDRCWKFLQGLWAFIQSFFTLGLAPILSDYTKRTWKKAIDGHDIQIIYLKTMEELETQTASATSLYAITPRTTVKKDGVFAEVEKATREIERNTSKRKGPSAVEIIAKLDRKQVFAIFDQIIKTFKEQKYKDAFGYRAWDEQLFTIPLGGKIETYHANVDNSCSIYNLKLRTILGLRNLVQYGPEIIDELKKKLFIAGEHHYEKNTGLQKVRNLVGNTIDLEQNLGRNIEEKVANELAELYIQCFKNRFKEFSAEFKDRKVTLIESKKASCCKKIKKFFGCGTPAIEKKEYKEIHQSTDNLDKGNYPIWKWGNTYYVNVPDLSEVVKALICAPYLYAESFQLIKKMSTSKQDQMLMRFFDEGTSTGCLNNKLSAIEEFQSEVYVENGKKESPQDVATKKFGKDLVDKAKKFYDFLNSDFIDDEKLVPKENAKTNITAWIKKVKNEYVKKAKAQNLLSKQLLVDGDLYQLLDEQVIEKLLKKYAEGDYFNRFLQKT